MDKKLGSPTKLTMSDVARIVSESGRSVIHAGTSVDEVANTHNWFAYDPEKQGLRSTQQINTDWSKFENHTFFESAQAKVNVAFDRIVNGFPFDGTRTETETFMNSLTGYEKWIFDEFPKNLGCLNFSGSYISVTDSSGLTMPEISKVNTGESMLDPAKGSYTFESHVFLPEEGSSVNVLMQKKHPTQNVGVCMYVLSGSSATSADIVWSVFSGSYRLSTSASVPRGSFFHVAGIYDRNAGGVAELYVDGLRTISSASFLFENINTSQAPLLVATGSSFTDAFGLVNPDKLFSGSLDELRLFSSARTTEQLSRYSTRNVYASNDLKLCYRFNEPSGTLDGTQNLVNLNSIVVDSSGKGFHSFVQNFQFPLRNQVSGALRNERKDLNPVLFYGFEDVGELNSSLLKRAVEYDAVNPNLITKLVPQHYLADGQTSQGYERPEGEIDEQFSKTGQLGSTQLLLGILYSWAKMFDEIKLFTDAFAKVKHVDYDPNASAPDVFLPFLFKELGLDFPNFFSDAAFAQYVDGEDIEQGYSLDEISLKNVQNQIMRRVLVNMRDILNSKGTIHSIEAFFRSVGIDPTNTFRIKERGGPTRRTLESIRQKTVEPLLFAQLSTGDYRTPYLSGSRSEPGFPDIAGPWLGNVSSNPNDGLWTSGSWTMEATYVFPSGSTTQASQSLARVYTTGSSGESLLVNVVATTGSNITMYVRAGDGANLTAAPLLSASLEADVFDGSPWHVSFGRERNDQITSSLGSRYFLSVGNERLGVGCTFLDASSFLVEAISGSDLFRAKSTTLNSSGSFVRIGSSSTTLTPSCLGNTSLVPNEARYTNFEGNFSHLRFWSKGLSAAERREHARNITSAGVSDPHIHYNFNTHLTGSFERMRLDVTCQQDERTTDGSGILLLQDFSQNELHMFTENVLPNAKILKPYVVGHSYISPWIDEAVTSEKIRVRSYDNLDKLVDNPWAEFAPLHEIRKSEEPEDDPRLSVDFSLVDALNKDIATMFATLEQLDSALGSMNVNFSSNYPALDHLRETYFHRLTDKLNFQAFFDFYRWFDSSVASFTELLVSKKAVFEGVNFVVESHMLERHKKQYFDYEMYLEESNKKDVDSTLLLQQVAGVARRF